MKRLPVLIFLAFFIISCAGHARLYPANEKAAQLGGVIGAKFKPQFGEGGLIWIMMPDGETFFGEYSFLQGNQVGFGSVYGSVYGDGGTSNFSGSGMSVTAPGQIPFMATLMGDRGARMTCEGYATRGRHGGGACEHSNGALYRLHF